MPKLTKKEACDLFAKNNEYVEDVYHLRNLYSGQSGKKLPKEFAINSKVYNALCPPAKKQLENDCLGLEARIYQLDDAMIKTIASRMKLKEESKEKRDLSGFYETNWVFSDTDSGVKIAFSLASYPRAKGYTGSFLALKTKSTRDTIKYGNKLIDALGDIEETTQMDYIVQKMCEFDSPALGSYESKVFKL